MLKNMRYSLLSRFIIKNKLNIVCYVQIFIPPFSLFLDVSCARFRRAKLKTSKRNTFSRTT